MAPGRIVPMLPALARGKRHPQRPGQVARRRRGARAACGAHRVAQHEAVVVPARGLQALQLHMYAVAERGQRGGLALLHDLGKACVVCHLPPHGVCGQHLRRIGQCEPRPQHHAVRRRVAAGDAQGKRVGLQRGRGAPGPAGEGGDGGSQGCMSQKLAPQLRRHRGARGRCAALRTGTAQASVTAQGPPRRAGGVPPPGGRRRRRHRGEVVTPPSPGSCPSAWRDTSPGRPARWRRWRSRCHPTGPRPR